MAFDPRRWTRLDHEGVPIWVRPDGPDWLVPNSVGDALLGQLAAGREPTSHEGRRFLSRLPDDGPHLTQGRRGLTGPPSIRELWLHVTDRCNLECRHCLFSCSADDGATMAPERALSLAGEAARGGCRVFALTGGEPFAHPEIDAIIDGLLDLDGAHVAVLTNATLLEAHAEAIEGWDRSRCHLQVSLDGLEESHDRVRGVGAFGQVRAALGMLRQRGVAFTLSMVPDADTVGDMPALVDLAAEVGASAVHFMWYFARGRAGEEGFVPTERLFDGLVAAALRGEELGIGVDNLDGLRTQVFAPPGTRHEGPSAGVESAALGPDGRHLYPSAALVGEAALAVPVGDGPAALATAFADGEPFRRFREVDGSTQGSPLRLLVGPGDPDHSISATGDVAWGDPYGPLHEAAALWLIARHATLQPDDGPPRLRLKMGDRLESCGAHGAVALVHGNCLLALASTDTRQVVKAFYSAAAETTKEDIDNPVCYPPELVEHIPPRHRVRGYGCGSPVLDARLAEGESVVDLGSGRGVECFIAASIVGRQGRVTGVDMLDPMLSRARQAAPEVAEALGYDVVRFEKGYLEELPVDDAAADVVLSNCVLNLSGDKRRTFGEALRILRPGGRLVVSDVVCEGEPDAAIRNDEQLKGECVAGALTQRDLFGLLDETGFVGARILKRFPYRQVAGHPFYSLTFEARRPDPHAVGETRVMFTGPGSYVTASGATLFPGEVALVSAEELAGATGALFALDPSGAVTNVDLGESACCSTADGSSSCCGPEAAAEPCCSSAAPGPVVLPVAAPCDCGGAAPSADAERHRSGCMVCGASLQYEKTPRPLQCSYCGGTFSADAACEEGHFVCDACHGRDGFEVIRRVCLGTEETDMMALLRRIRTHEAIPVHGPEHHAMVPGIILATYRNLGGDVPDEMLLAGIERGAAVPGGQCGFMGVCGAAAGVGVAFGLLTGSGPLTAAPRQQLHGIVARVLGKIGELEAARCCQRDSWVALREAALLSAELLPITLRADEELSCTQIKANAECIKGACPLFPRRRS